MRLIGDIHGKIMSYADVAHGHDTVQIGDFGIGFLTPNQNNAMEKLHSSGTHKFIRGNHDDPEKCKTTPGYIPDGTVDHKKSIMYIGGAASVNAMMRTPGLDWWLDEELSVVQFTDMFHIYEKNKPSVMITHTCPHSAAMNLFGKTARWPIVKTKTCDSFDYMLSLHQPDLWVFGHWHTSVRKKIGRTEFVCLNELEYIDI